MGKLSRKEEKERGGGGGDTHVTQLIFLMQINNQDYKWKWCCCDREREREIACFFVYIWNSLSGEARRGRSTLTQRVKSITAARGTELDYCFGQNGFKKWNCPMQEGRRKTVVLF